MRRRRSCRRMMLTSALTLVLAGCHPPQRPLPSPPAVRLDTSAIVGGLLEATPATQPTTTPATAAGMIGVQVTWAVVGHVPGNLLDPLDAHAALISAPLAGGPVLTSGRQTAAARFGQGAAADALLRRLLDRADGPVRQVGYQVGVLVPASTTTFRLILDNADAPARSVALSLSSPPQADWEPDWQPLIDQVLGQFAVQLHRTAQSRPATSSAVTRPASTQPTTLYATVRGELSVKARLAMTVTLEGFREMPTASDDAPAAPATQVATPETAYVDGLNILEARRYALAFPCRLGTTPWRGIVAFIDFVPPPPDAAAIAAAQFARPSATQPVTQPAVERTLMRAVDALRTNADPRPPLLFLATATRAAIAADAILIAGRPVLDRLRSDVLQYAKDHDVADAAALGWHLDQSAVLLLCGTDSAGPLPPELAAVLVVHGGEVGRHPDAMADAAKNVGSAADLKARLIGENTIALEDNSPSARVRAFDWLKAQGRAPEGYDPLADAHARRAAINRAIGTTQGTR